MIFLCGCAGTENGSGVTPEPTSIPTPVPTPEPDPKGVSASSTHAEHSLYYAPDYSVEEIIEYFCEVTLSAEYPSEDYAPVLHKWVTPISYCLAGDYTESDKALAVMFFECLNCLRGFPGARLTADESGANLIIRFCLRDEFYERMGEAIGNEEADGAVQYWYSMESNELVSAEICCRNDVLTDPVTRSSVILEEICNGIGASNDTVLREDSIIYQYGSSVTFPSDTDWLLLRLIYAPQMTPGMDREACEKVLRVLYW